MISGTVCVLLGATVLVGWSIHSVFLIQVKPSLPPMQRMSALSFLFCGLAICLLVFERYRAAAVCAAVPLFFAVAVGLEYFFDANLGIDQLLGSGYITVLSPYPGRMSQLTMAALLLLASALTFAAFTRLGARASAMLGVVGAVALTVGLVSWLSYTMAPREAFVWRHVVHVALETRIALMLAGTGLLAVAWNQNQHTSIYPQWLPLSVWLSISVCVLGLWQAFILSEGHSFAALSHALLVGGLIIAALFGLTVYLAQQAFHRSLELLVFRMAFENSLDGIILATLNGRILTANPSACRILERTQEEIRQEGSKGLVVDDPSVRRLLDVRKHTGRAQGETIGRRKDGSLFPLEVSSVVFKDPLGHVRTCNSIRDISARKQAEEKLRESEERFRRVFEEGLIGIVLVGKDFRFFKVNNAFCRMVGYSEEELRTRTFGDITHPEDLRAGTKVAEQLFKGEITSCQFEKRYIRKDGKVIWANLSSSVIRDAAGNMLYALSMIEDISERKQAERKIRDQAALLQLAHDAIIVHDMQARIIFWNRGAEDSYGWLAEQAAGRVIHKLLETVFPVPLDEIKAIVKAGGQWEGELEHTRYDGKKITVISRWSLLRDEQGLPHSILEINRDISARKRVESELRIQTERLSLANRAASIGVWDLDLRTQQTIWDDTLFAMFGIPRQVPMPYNSWSRTVHPDDLPAAEASLKRVIEGKTQDYCEFRIFRPDGSLRHIASAQGAVLDEKKRVIRIVGVGMDISERKRMEEQLALSARLSALGSMAGGVAHEINNPLAIISALASNLLDSISEHGQVPREEVVHCAGRIQNTVGRIAKIVASLRHIAGDGSQDGFASVPVKRIVDETLDICQERFHTHAVILQLPEIDPNLHIRCREAQIAQILLNLLANAFDAAVGQPQENWVRLEITRSGDSVLFSVIDSGPSIPEGIKSRLMEPFFTTKEVGKGMGLGLSLSRAIAEEHGGKLELVENGGNTCFRLSLPAAERVNTYAA